MVACPHAAASAAGVDVLRAGGSAVDAAIAAASTLGVIYPHMCGIGGDAFWLIYDAAARKVSYLDGGGRAAATASLERFNQKEIPFRGIVPATLTTPGAVASFCEAHARFGKLPLARCLEHAIGYARDGYPVSARLAHWIAETAVLIGKVIGTVIASKKDPELEGLKLLLIKNAQERVASFLLEMAERASGNVIELSMSRQDIADYLGLTIETVSRTLSSLETAAAIEVPTSRRIVLRNRDALRS